MSLPIYHMSCNLTSSISISLVDARKSVRRRRRKEKINNLWKRDVSTVIN